MLNSQAVPISNAVFVSLWSMASGVTLIVHITVARLYNRKPSANREGSQSRTNDCRTFHQESPASYMKDTTRVPTPKGSIADDA